MLTFNIFMDHKYLFLNIVLCLTLVHHLVNMIRCFTCLIDGKLLINPLYNHNVGIAPKFNRLIDFLLNYSD